MMVFPYSFHSMRNRLRFSLWVLVLWVFTSTLSAQNSSDDPQDSSANNEQQEAVADNKEPEPTPEADEPVIEEKVFIPSEEISEDDPVPFPMTFKKQLH